MAINQEDRDRDHLRITKKEDHKKEDEKINFFYNFL
jgi:hypothetical protein